MYFYVLDIQSTTIKPPFSDHFFAMRVQKGKKYGICDQKGSAVDVTIDYVDKKNKTVTVTHTSEAEYKHTTRKGTLYQALIDRQYQEKLCEVLPLTNFDKLVFVATEQSSPQQPSIDRLESIIQRSSSQCQTLWKPELSTQILNFSDVIKERVTILNSDSNYCIDHKVALQNTCFVGPEGGWSEQEQKEIAESKSGQVFYPNIVYPAWISGLIYSTKMT